MTTVLIAYAAGTSEMLDVCLSSIERHDAGADYSVKVVTDDRGYVEALEVAGQHDDVGVFGYNIGSMKNGSMMHGTLLDMAIKDVDSEYVLSLDSDCFPVAPDWLKTLHSLAEGSVISGILWPWIPPPPEMDEMAMEYRIRKNHCWDNTSVICQLIKKSFIFDNKLKYVDGDDTGFAVVRKAHMMGMPVVGLMPTRCALPSGDLNPEMNRHICMVFGDMIYHQGGSSRRAQGASIDPSGYYVSARERVFSEKGAEWILKEENSHKYRFDDEEEVAQFKMRAMFDEMRRYLQTNDRLFEPA